MQSSVFAKTAMMLPMMLPMIPKSRTIVIYVFAKIVMMLPLPMMLPMIPKSRTILI